MERVHFQQERMLGELKDLVEKNLFTQQETRQIMKKRTAFESLLIRRVAKKADFVRYAAYEMGLEQLRRKRVERMGLAKGPATVSDYAMVQRQFDIFERAVKKFKSDVGLWVQYMQIAKREGARGLVSRITARALQMHPNKPELFILAASQELDEDSPSGARVLLQRGIRLNPERVDMWVEYVRMELGFVERMRRRWEVLGITAGDDVEARGQVMEGAIVESVISSAAQALPRLELFAGMRNVLCEHPSPDSVRRKLLDHLYRVLASTLPRDPRAVVFGARRSGPGLDGLAAANTAILARMRTGDVPGLEEAYAEFVAESELLVESPCGAAVL